MSRYDNTPDDYRNYLRVCPDCGERYHDSAVHECPPDCSWDGDDDGVDRAEDVENRRLFMAELWENER